MELALELSEPSSLFAAYADVVYAFDVKWIDFHLEGNSLTNRTSIDLRSNALRDLQNNLNGALKVTISFHATPTGLSADQLFVLSSAAISGVKIDGKNGA